MARIEIAERILNKANRKRLDDKVEAIYNAAMTFRKAQAGDPVLFHKGVELSQKKVCADDLAKWIDEEFDEEEMEC